MAECFHVRLSLAMLHSVPKRFLRAVYKTDRFPGKRIRPMLLNLPSVLSSSRASRHFSGLQNRKTVVLCVYRRRNAHVVHKLINGCASDSTEIRLWALDSVAPSLARFTCGSGQGPRCTLLNRLWTQSTTNPDWLVIADDDVALLRSWTLSAVIGAMSMLDVDFAQPAHAANSHHSHWFNVRRPLVAGRAVGAVEIGPLFLVKAPWIDRVVPFSKDAGMGYFLEWFWATFEKEGCRSAVLDCVPMRHLGAVGASYGSVALGSSEQPDAGSVSVDQLVSQSPNYGRLLWPSSIPRADCAP